MTIGIDASRANRAEKTGIEWYAYHLLNTMKKITDSNDRFLLYTDTALTDALAELPNNWKEQLLGWLPKKFWTQGRLSLEMLLRAPDLLFIPSHVIPVAHPKRVVLTCHDIGFERRPELYPKAELLYHRWSMRYGVRHATQIIAVSDFTKRELMDVYDIPEKRITVIYHGFYGGARGRSAACAPADNSGGVDGSVARAEEEGSRNGWSATRTISEGRRVIPEGSPSETGQLPRHRSVSPASIAVELPANDRYFLYVGRIEAKKNLHVIIDAFTELKRAKKIPDDMRLLLVGRLGYQSEGILRVAREKGRGTIRYLPWVPSETLQQLYQHATAFLFPSLYEGFGLPLLEALSYGVPVIASDIPVLREIGGDAAIFAAPTVDDFASAMQAIIENPSTLMQKQQWKEYVKRFSWEIAAQKTLTVLHNAL